MMRNLFFVAIFFCVEISYAQTLSEPVLFAKYDQAFTNPKSMAISAQDEIYVLSHNTRDAGAKSLQQLYSFDNQQKLRWERDFEGAFFSGRGSLAVLPNGSVLVSLFKPYGADLRTELKIVSAQNEIVKEFSFASYNFSQVVAKDAHSAYLAGKKQIGMYEAKALIALVDLDSGKILNLWTDEERTKVGLEYNIEGVKVGAEGQLYLAESCAAKGDDAIELQKDCDPAVLELDSALKLVKRIPTIDSYSRLAVNVISEKVYSSEGGLYGLNLLDEPLWAVRRGPVFRNIASSAISPIRDLLSVGKNFFVSGVGKLNVRGVYKSGWIGAFDSSRRVIFEKTLLTNQKAISVDLLEYSPRLDKIFLVAKEITQFAEVEAPHPRDLTFSQLKLFSFDVFLE